MRTVLSMSVCAIMLITLFNGSAMGLPATIHWTGAGGNDLWQNGKNWDPNRTPQYEDEVVIDAPGAAQPRYTAESTMPKSVVFIGVGYAGKSGSLTVEGGTLECNCGIVGVKDKKKGRRVILTVPVANATITMSGGTIRAIGESTNGGSVCSGGLLQWGRSNANATFNMTGGLLDFGTVQIPASDVNSQAVFNLDGGVVNVKKESGGSMGLFIGESGNRTEKWKGVMNISGGKLILAGDATALINKYVNETKVLVPYPAKDAASYNKYVVADFNTRNAGKTTVTAAASAVKAAYKPSPIDGAAFVEKGAALSWSAGKDAANHNVYFGTDKEAVKNGADAAKEPGKGSISETTFKPGELAMNTTYYWKVDEVDGSGNVTKGDVWSLTVAEKPKVAEPNKPAEQPMKHKKNREPQVE